MLSVLRWKDILKPIRDGYRHLFPAPDTGPTPEERAKKRKLDRLKGFAYFDTIKQLEDWTEDTSDPLQRANTPLLPRLQRIKNDSEKRAGVLICHDYSGGYHDYEDIHGNASDEEYYSCEHLQFVDTFIYFSHKLVCVPPPSWTNLLHRNGVKSLGTLLVEPQTKDSERLLRRADSSGGRANFTFPVATQLASIARHYGFDGWLINIEKSFTGGQWDYRNLQVFLEQLRTQMGSEESLNSLTRSNLPFAKTCGNILINYCWTEDSLRDTTLLASTVGLPLGRIFFGVDVWAQNKSSFTHPRVTFPEKGGGGTNTGLAVEKLAEYGLSVGIFAPAWSFEHFPGQGRVVDKHLWHGGVLPSGINCSCGDAIERHPPNRRTITCSAARFPAGSESFFYTDFASAFASTIEDPEPISSRDAIFRSQLSSQAILPIASQTTLNDDRGDTASNALSQRLESLSSGSQLVIEAQRNVALSENEHAVSECHLTIFDVDMPADGSLHCKITYRRVAKEEFAASFYLKYEDRTAILPWSPGRELKVLEADIRSREPSSRLKEFGVTLQSKQLGKERLRIAEVTEVCIAPKHMFSKERMCNIHDVYIRRQGDGETRHWRLFWSYTDEEGEDSQQMSIPYSNITGPFSYFLIIVEGRTLGRAYGLEYVVPDSALKEHTGVAVSIVGVGFDGRHLTTAREELVCSE
ncbi:hypothetical protein EJ04DRAFT_492658 [Polyplosphaeria fusca]|uniref:Cytosolic endo-beta-N-acetylglucosaminidase TIM barrel domain-containing protein n=1 Tax=Polyplosphaeria fusca TaxID=682080 RepID=A0A9P4V364_9PLEO|nr:hypothetical protein EJ04DRAFT_492658 [Polyplosphaeria fusca]